ncbi:MAG: hypothetical protein ACFB51_22130 [Anaerolineae bacterium]
MERRALLFTLIAALLGSLVLSACAAPTGSEAEGNNAPANDPLLILDWSRE